MLSPGDVITSYFTSNCDNPACLSSSTLYQCLHVMTSYSQSVGADAVTKIPRWRHIRSARPAVGCWRCYQVPPVTSFLRHGEGGRPLVVGPGLWCVVGVTLTPALLHCPQALCGRWHGQRSANVLGIQRWVTADPEGGRWEGGAHPWGGVSPFKIHYSIAFKHQSITGRPPLHGEKSCIRPWWR